MRSQRLYRLQKDRRNCHREEVAATTDEGSPHLPDSTNAEILRFAQNDSASSGRNLNPSSLRGGSETPPPRRSPTTWQLFECKKACGQPPTQNGASGRPGTSSR